MSLRTVPLTWTITLPYDKPPLTLNSRHHWTARYRIEQRVKADTDTLIRAAKVPPLERAVLTLTYRPRDRRRRDTDNLWATYKPVQDALVAARVLPDDAPEYVTGQVVIAAPGPAYDGRHARFQLIITDAGQENP